MRPDDFAVTGADRRMAEIYRDFLPEKVFDAHSHMHVAAALPGSAGPGTVYAGERGTPADYWADMGPILPGVREIRLNMMAAPHEALTDTANGLRDMANDHILRLAGNGNVVAPYILPTDTEEDLDALSCRPGVRGFKCYAYGAGRTDLEALRIGDFLPESAWVVANEKKLPIILHMMRPKALADPDNFKDINRMARKYPDAKLVLAHCARSFSAWTAVTKIRELEDRGNIWFDLAAICEPGPMMASIMKNAAKRTMWGSDYPICMLRGRAVSIGDSMVWLTGDQYPIPDRPLLAAENLMAFYQAAILLNLDQTQVNDLFWNNAMALFHPET